MSEPDRVTLKVQRGDCSLRRAGRIGNISYVQSAISPTISKTELDFVTLEATRQLEACYVKALFGGCFIEPVSRQTIEDNVHSG